MLWVAIDPATTGNGCPRVITRSYGLVHHPNLVHGSGPNATERQRRALALRYRSVVDR